jgi:hypothetical protein
MKKLLILSAFQIIAIISLKAQPVSDYLYKLDNGITLKSEHTWSQVWVQQTFTPLAPNDQIPLAVSSRTLGELISGQTYNLMSKGKEVKLKGVAPGTYDLKMAFKLSGKPGTLSFVVGNVQIKDKTKTTLSITLYDYQLMIDESAISGSQLSGFETSVKRCKSSTDSEGYTGIPSFYTKDDHNNAIKPDEAAGKTKGKIKPGTYDLLVTINISGQNHKLWLQNFQMKPGTSYKITTNLNAGGIIYAGTNKDVKAMHLYPAGTAAKQTGNPAPVKNLETISYTDIKSLNCCTPGTFDVLLHIGNGDKYEWRKGVAVTTGTKTEVK